MRFIIDSHRAITVETEIKANFFEIKVRGRGPEKWKLRDQRALDERKFKAVKVKSVLIS